MLLSSVHSIWKSPLRPALDYLSITDIFHKVFYPTNNVLLHGKYLPSLVVLVEEAGVDQLLKEELHIAHLQLRDDDRYSKVFAKFHPFLTESLLFCCCHRYQSSIITNTCESWIPMALRIPRSPRSTLRKTYTNAILSMQSLLLLSLEDQPAFEQSGVTDTPTHSWFYPLLFIWNDIFHKPGWKDCANVCIDTVLQKWY